MNTHPIWHNHPMCGRYRLSRRQQIIEEHFDSVSGEEDWTPRYSVAFLAPIPANSLLARLRISGWLLYDLEHTGAIGTQRASVWDVHPITKIEVNQNNTWVDLDQ